MKSFLKILILFSVFALSCSGKAYVTPETILADEIARYMKALDDSVQFNQSPEIILHRGGSYQQYAKNVNCKEFGTETAAVNITALMKLSFDAMNATAVEIDLRTIDGLSSFPKPYIVHDAIDKKYLLKDLPKIKVYLWSNSIDIVINHFIENSYHLRGKKIYIELKVPRKSIFFNNEELDRAEEQYVDQCVNCIDEKIRSMTDSENEYRKIRDSIDFISFNLYALKRVHTLKGTGYKVHYLAATNRPLGHFPCMQDLELNYLNKKMSDMLVNAQWLDGIWFDPFAISDAAETFNSINDKRVKKGFSVCPVYLFVYRMELEDLAAKFKKQMMTANGKERKLEYVQGLCFESKVFKDDREASCR